MLSNAAESTPILLELKNNLYDENKWITLSNRQTTHDAQLEVLWRAVATVPTSVELWEQLIQAVVASNDQPTAEKVLKQAIDQFPSNIKLWKLAMHLFPSVETFNVALERIDSSVVWPEFLSYIARSRETPLETRFEVIKNAITRNVCTLEDALQSVPELGELLLMYFKPQIDLWRPFISVSTNPKFVSEALRQFELPELVNKLALLQPSSKESRSVYVHFLDQCSSASVYAAVYKDAVNLYQSEIDKSRHARDWSGGQLLLAEFRNLIRKRAGQISELATKEDPQNIALWLMRADLFKDSPHVAANAIEQAITCIESGFYQSEHSGGHNGELADLYIRYSELLVKNGSDWATAQKPLISFVSKPVVGLKSKAKAHGMLAKRSNSERQYLEDIMQIEELRPYMWTYYLSALRHDQEALLNAFSRCCISKDISVRLILQVCDSLSESNQEAVLKKGVSVFPAPHSLPIWKRYLKYTGGFGFNKAFEEFYNFTSEFEQLVLVYVAHETNPLMKRKAISRITNKTRNIKVWKEYISTFSDPQEKRVSFETAIHRLDNHDASCMALEMAAFEESQNELVRSRQLYNYASQLA